MFNYNIIVVIVLSSRQKIKVIKSSSYNSVLMIIFDDKNTNNAEVVCVLNTVIIIILFFFFIINKFRIYTEVIYFFFRSLFFVQLYNLVVFCNRRGQTTMFERITYGICYSQILAPRNRVEHLPNC